MQGSLQPIHAAATTGHLNVVQLLIDTYGVVPTVKTEVSIKSSTNEYNIINIYIAVIYMMLTACPDIGHVHCNDWNDSLFTG